MSDPYFQTQFAARIGGANYGKGPRSTSSKRSNGPNAKPWPNIPNARSLTSASVENDEPAPGERAPRVGGRSQQASNRGYADNGIAAYKEAAAWFMKRTFNVDLDPVTEVNHCIGTKTAAWPCCPPRSSTRATSR